uniref:COP9 signalosome complex subunit 3 n=1 Tax=Panagrolaimus sp. PS1159 TaxID=55785 RepID=A0AC35GFH5_9BILA
MAASANNNPAAFIGSVKLLCGEEKQAQLFNYVMKSCEEFASNENLNGLNKILAEINAAQYPLPAFAALSTKLQIHGKFNTDELKATIAKLRTMTSAVKKELMTSKFATVYFLTLKALADACIAKKIPLLGIKPLYESILWYTDGHPELLTPAHASFLCLCLKARNFYLCDKIIDIDSELLLQQGLDYRRNNKASSSLMACTSEPVLLFFYYAALIRIAQCRYKEGQLLIEQLLCMRGMCNSAIAIEAFKVGIIVALILEQDQLFLPGCRNVKFLQSLSRPYLSLAYIVTSAKLSDNIPALIKDYAEKNRKIFQQDGNVGLIDVLVRKLQEKKITAMPKTFINIDQNRAMNRTFFNDNDNFDAIVRKLINNHELKCSIDDGSNIYSFRKLVEGKENKEANNENEIDLNVQLQNLADFTNVVRNVHDRLKVVPQNSSGNGKQSHQSKKRLMI